MRALRIRQGDLDGVLAHAREGAPDEVCGILAGRRDADGATVEQVFPTKNSHPRPRGEYLIDLQEQLRILLHVEDDLGLEVVGFYHSHPAGPARLSATDAARATWPDASYLLAWLKPEAGFGSWRWDDAENRFDLERLEIVEGAAFVVDTTAGIVHRAATAPPACLEAIPAGARQEAADELRASMVLKTRHYKPCPVCWGS